MGREDDHTDETGPDSNQYNVSGQHADSINTGNIGPGSDTSTKHTKPFQLEHPVAEVEDLYGSEYGHYLLREAEVDNGVEPGDRSQEAERRVERAFDLRVIEITNRVLQLPVTDATRGEFPIEDSAVLALVLQRVRAAPTKDFSSHLEAVPEVHEALGVDGTLDETTITAWEQELTETDEKAIEACATRVLYAVYRSGHAFPQQVWNAAVAAPDTGLLTSGEKERFDDGKLPVGVTREALRNWAREFLETCVQGEFSLARDESRTKYSVMSIVGVFAHAALQSRTITGACKTCAGWYVIPELVPDRTTVMEPIGDMSIDAIAKMFEQINHNFLEMANEYTILRGSKQFAFDPTSIPYYGESQNDRWPKGYAEPLKGDVDSADFDQQVEFGLAAVTEGDVRFALGMYPIKSEYRDGEQDRGSVRAADVVSRLMRPTRLETPVSVDVVIMDRGLSGADLIRRCRNTVGDNWIILGKQEAELADLVEKTPQSKPKFETLDEYPSDLARKPNAFVVPVPEEFTRAKDSQWVFLTDLPEDAFTVETSEDEQKLDPEIVLTRYKNRTRIEKTLQQLKSDFNIPVHENTHTRVKYFCLNISMLFYNLHNLIINSISPRFGLPLGKTRGASNGEVLSAIREVAFELAAEQTPEVT
jgi:hypothetical protein